LTSGNAGQLRARGPSGWTHNGWTPLNCATSAGMDPAAPNPLLRSFERHLRAENRSDQTVATYLIALRQAETFLTGSRGTTFAEAGRGGREGYPGDLLTRRD